jgi:hypothetical protein
LLEAVGIVKGRRGWLGAEGDGVEIQFGCFMIEEANK